MNTIVRIFLLITCLIVGATLLAAIGEDFYTHAGRDSGAMSGKAVVELILVGIVSLIFLKWSRDLWRKLRHQS